MKKIVLATPRGFCAGVDRAIHVVEKAIEKFGTPIYVRHEIVHNKFVVETLKDKGVVFVDELDQVPEGSVVIFSAHGVAERIYEEAKARNLQVLDASCPLVRACRGRRYAWAAPGRRDYAYQERKRCGNG